MQHTEIVVLLKGLKLHGMAKSLPDVIPQARNNGQGIEKVLEGPCIAETSERRARSICYQMRTAKFPISKDTSDFDFEASTVYEAVIQGHCNADFLDQAWNLIFVGGTGTGKSHF